MMQFKFFIVLIVISVVESFGQTNSISIDAYATIFSKGDSDYACFRIPAIVMANDGSLLAFSEARKQGCSDTGNIDIVMRKSEDQGKTWGELRVLWDDDQNVCGNPSPVVDKVTGTIHLLSTWNNGEDHESEIIQETSTESREVYHQSSNDNGDTWSTPKNITTSTKQINWTWYATGPVHGLQIQQGRYKGRLVIPCDHIERGSKKYYSHCIYSDNHGLSWKLGNSTPNDQVNECTVAELKNGDLMLNMRNYQRKEAQARQIAISKDGGISWENQYIDNNLPEPRCQGALLNISNEDENILMFSNPADSKSRINLTLSISYDEGKSWKRKIEIYKGPSAYSDLVQLENENILVVFEGGEKEAYEGIYYKILDINNIVNLE